MAKELGHSDAQRIGNLRPAVYKRLQQAIAALGKTVIINRHLSHGMIILDRELILSFRSFKLRTLQYVAERIATGYSQEESVGIVCSEFKNLSAWVGWHLANRTANDRPDAPVLPFIPMSVEGYPSFSWFGGGLSHLIRPWLEPRNKNSVWELAQVRTFGRALPAGDTAVQERLTRKTIQTLTKSQTLEVLKQQQVRAVVKGVVSRLSRQLPEDSSSTSFGASKCFTGLFGKDGHLSQPQNELIRSELPVFGEMLVKDEWNLISLPYGHVYDFLGRLLISAESFRAIRENWAILSKWPLSWIYYREVLPLHPKDLIPAELTHRLVQLVFGPDENREIPSWVTSEFTDLLLLWAHHSERHLYDHTGWVRGTNISYFNGPEDAVVRNHAGNEVYLAVNGEDGWKARTFTPFSPQYVIVQRFLQHNWVKILSAERAMRIGFKVDNPIWDFLEAQDCTNGVYNGTVPLDELFSTNTDQSSATNNFVDGFVNAIWDGARSGVNLDSSDPRCYLLEQFLADTEIHSSPSTHNVMVDELQGESSFTVTTRSLMGASMSFPTLSLGSLALVILSSYIEEGRNEGDIRSLETFAYNFTSEGLAIIGDDILCLRTERFYDILRAQSGRLRLVLSKGKDLGSRDLSILAEEHIFREGRNLHYLDVVKLRLFKQGKASSLSADDPIVGKIRAVGTQLRPNYLKKWPDIPKGYIPLACNSILAWNLLRDDSWNVKILGRAIGLPTVLGGLEFPVCPKDERSFYAKTIYDILWTLLKGKFTTRRTKQEALLNASMGNSSSRRGILPPKYADGGEDEAIRFMTHFLSARSDLSDNPNFVFGVREALAHAARQPGVDVMRCFHHYDSKWEPGKRALKYRRCTGEIRKAGYIELFDLMAEVDSQKTIRQLCFGAPTKEKRSLRKALQRSEEGVLNLRKTYLKGIKLIPNQWKTSGNMCYAISLALKGTFVHERILEGRGLITDLRFKSSFGSRGNEEKDHEILLSSLRSPDPRRQTNMHRFANGILAEGSMDLLRALELG